MGSIIKMGSQDFFDFVDRYDYREFEFVVISNDIRHNGKHENVAQLQRLIPPANIVSEFITNGYTKKYKKKYMKYLSRPEVEALIITIVQMAVVKDINVVLLCSDNESQYSYLDMISEFIENEYNCKPCSYKKFRKNKKHTDLTKDAKKISALIDKKIKEIGLVINDEESEKDLKKELKKFSKSELIGLCETNHIKIKSKWDKKQIIKEIMKKSVFR